MKKIILLLLLLFIPISIFAQQFSVDDTETVESRSFTLENWTGTHGYWNKVSIPFFRKHMEVSAGVGTYDIKYDRFFIEGKWITPDLRIFGLNLGRTGFVYGSEYDFNFYVKQFYGYIPYSVDIKRFNFIGNVGFNNQFIALPIGWDFKFNWGVRTDYKVTDNIFIISEVHNKLFDRILVQKGIRYSIFDNMINIFASAGSEVGIKRGKYRVRVLTSANEFIVLDGRESIDILDRNRVPYFNLGISVTPKF